MEMDSFVAFSGPSGYQEDDSHFAQPSASSLADQHKTAFFHQHQIPCDIKPRLTKEQHDILEGHFQRAPKPNTATKKTFADTLGVSLDKVNNWFQNRRAKSKQDAKKAHGTYNMLAQQQTNHSGFSSDSELSPAFAASDYFSIMQQFAADEQAPGLGISHAQEYQNQDGLGGLPYSDSMGDVEQLQEFIALPQMPQEMFDSPQELNRRTLTQDQFDAFAQNAAPMNGPENYEYYPTGYAGGHHAMHEMYSVPEDQICKQQNAFVLQNNVPLPMSSHDSSLGSSLSEQSLPSMPYQQDPSSISASSSEWNHSRSSSLHQDELFMEMSGSAQQPARATSQWQPGQSVPVDYNALSQEFRQVAQARPSLQQPQAHEQPLAWPADEAYVRKESSTSLLEQNMSNVGINTPQLQHQATFKSPAPPATIAARRQRPRPAGLHLGPVRSHSYNGASQPGSPAPQQQQSLTGQPLLTPGQPLRRIRSNNIMSGVAQGRVQKLPGSAQRSPLAWTFADAMSSPKAFRHVSGQSSTSTLAPPTPMSPGEILRPQVPSWQACGHVSRQPSISETDFEHGVVFAPSASAPPRNFTSPPQTPMYQAQSFAKQRISNSAMNENTPPQSAPASQQCFPINTFPVQSQMQPPPPHQHQLQQTPVQQMQMYAPQQQQYMNVGMPEQQFQAPNVTFAPSQHFMMPTTAAPTGVPMQFSTGVPVVNEHGVLQMMYPAPMQPVQFIQHAPPSVQAPPQPQPQQQLHTPPQGQYGMFSTVGPTPSLKVAPPPPRQPTPQPKQELFVHEYSPPQELKRAATPRRHAVDTGPKNYVFAHQTPEHFGKGKKSADAKASNSPASNSS
ncbi:hypothetical protein LTR08_006913 [Meristemomyces frigidus]|nr:hypothetical protein LTR08_006913 [Meristemomyces frigidus]